MNFFLPVRSSHEAFFCGRGQREEREGGMNFFLPPLLSLVHSRRPADARAFGLGVRSIYPSTAPRGAQLRVEPATSDSLRTMVTLGCAALHFAGHGHPDFLCFEVSNDVAHKDLNS